MAAPASPPSTFPHKSQTPTAFCLFPISSLSIYTPHILRFAPLTSIVQIKSSKPLYFSSQPVYNAVTDIPEDDEEAPIGDCLVYEEGIFDDPFLQNSRNFRNVDTRLEKEKSTRTATETEPGNLIPEDWLEMQRELNITKKDRRKLSQQLQYGRKVEKRRQELRPINAEVYENFKNKKLQQLKPVVLDIPELKHLADNNDNDNDKKSANRGSEEGITGRVAPRNPRLTVYGGGLEDNFNNEKLQQLKPVVLDNPELKHLADNNDNDSEKKSANRGSEEGTTGRVAPRNPRLAVYGGGLEDISEFFSSSRYDPGASNKSQGTRKLFSKEEKLLLNRRQVPDLAIATSGKWHPLHTLVASGEFYLVNSLLKHNININAPDKDGLTAIHRAILGKKQAIFNFLLRESINPFVRDKEGATLLHYAVYIASSHMIKILLLYNVDINLQDKDGWTPLHLAVLSRRTDIVRLLLIKGADKTLTNRDGLTPLDLCLYSGRDTRTYELIKLIKRYS